MSQSDRDFERKLVLASLYDVGFGAYCLENLDPSCFDDPVCFVIFHHMQSLYRRKEPVVFGSVIEELKDDASLSGERLADAVRLLQPYFEDPDHRFLESTLASVLPKAKKHIADRLLTSAVTEATRLLGEGRYQDIFRLFKHVEKQTLYNVIEETDFWDFEGMDDPVESSGYIPTAISGKDEYGVKVCLDDYLFHGGLGRGQLMIIFGKAKLGKTTALLNMAFNMMLMGFTVHYYTLELKTDYLILRALSSWANVPTNDLRDDRRLVNDLISRLKKTYPDADSIKFFDCPTGKLTPFAIEQNLTHTGEKGTVDAIFVDYVDLMAPAESARSEWASMSLNTQRLRGIASEYDLVCVTASQFGKSGLDRQDLGGSDVYGSVSKIFVADAVGFLNEKRVTETGDPKLLQVKEELVFTLGYARYGESGTRIYLDADRKCGRIFPILEPPKRRKKG